MDKIIIKEAKFMCNIGVTREERRKKQKVLVDIELFLDTKKAAKTDSIKDTINYSYAYGLIKKMAERKEYSLIEAMAEGIAKGILHSFKIPKVLVRIKKPKALADRNVKYAAVEVIREK